MSASSSSKPKVNLRSTAVKRIMQEASELGNPQDDDFVANPLENDIFEWHCTMRGVPDSDYEGGLYHLRILLPHNYPMAAPDIILLTPNGRFELGKKICIDGLTSFHAGSWQPAWGVRTALTGLRSFWMQEGEALSAIGALDCSKDERRRLAKLSRDWRCPTCQTANHEHFPAVDVADLANASLRVEGPKDSAGAAEKVDVHQLEETEKPPEPVHNREEPSRPSVATGEPSEATIRPSRTTPPDSPISPRPVPKWIDIPLCFLVLVLVFLIMRRLL